MTFIGKSDIVVKAVSLTKEEPTAMPKNRAPEESARASNEQSYPGEDPVALALRRLHDDVVAEPLPDDFLRLLDQIERKIAGQAVEE